MPCVTSTANPANTRSTSCKPKECYATERALESPEDREARLHQDQVTHQQRLASETPEEREVRLHQLRASQEQRIAAEKFDYIN